MTTKKKIIAIVISFTLGLVLSTSLIAQDAQQIARIEATIAQLQAELAQLKANQQAANETAWSPELLPPPSQGLVVGQPVAPGQDSRIVTQDPEIILPENQGIVSPQSTLPAAEIPPALLQQPGAVESILPAAPLTRLQPRPTFIVPSIAEYCPLSGQVYRTQRPIYYQVQPVPRFNYEWDYFDEDRAGRHRYDDRFRR